MDNVTYSRVTGPTYQFNDSVERRLTLWLFTNCPNDFWWSAHTDSYGMRTPTIGFKTEENAILYALVWL